MKKVASLALAAALAIVCATPFAQGYPNRPIRIVVPFPAGGGADSTARILGQKLAERWGQQVLVDNRSGAAGNIGTELVARAAPDGYTLGIGVNGTHAINPSLYPKLGFDPVRDFAPIALALSVPALLIVHPALPASSVPQLVALAKARPGELNYASGGLGSPPHVMGELFASMAGIKLGHVPYKGAAPAAIDVIAGFVPIMFDNLVSGLPHVRSRKVRALGVTSLERSPVVPEIPTIAESGLPGYEAVTWIAVFAPAGTPREIVTRLNSEIVAILAMQEVRDRFSAMGATVGGGTPEQLASLLRDDLQRWAQVIKAANIRLE